MQRPIQSLRERRRADGFGSPEQFALLERAMRRHLRWAIEHRAVGEVEVADEVLADVRAIQGELRLDA